MTLALILAAALLAWIHADRIGLAIGVVGGSLAAIGISLFSVIFRVARG